MPSPINFVTEFRPPNPKFALIAHRYTLPSTLSSVILSVLNPFGLTSTSCLRYLGACPRIEGVARESGFEADFFMV